MPCFIFLFTVCTSWLLKSCHTCIYAHARDGKGCVCGVVGTGETQAAHDAGKSHGGSEES